MFGSEDSRKFCNLVIQTTRSIVYTKKNSLWNHRFPIPKKLPTFIYVCLLEVSDERKFIQLFSLDDSVVNSGLET